jgi:hypothetical protein
VRRSLKEEKRIAAERRGESDLRMARWEVSLLPGKLGFGADEQSNRKGIWANGFLWEQNGKQGEFKNIDAVSADAYKTHAGQQASA